MNGSQRLKKYQELVEIFDELVKFKVDEIYVKEFLRSLKPGVGGVELEKMSKQELKKKLGEAMKTYVKRER